MDLTKYNFPKVSKVDLAFSTFDTIPELLAEAEKRGFDHNNKYCRYFGKLFFGGGSVVFKTGLDENFKNNAFLYMRALMGSFAPKHEHKEAVCGMLLSELVELPENI